ncbi:MAG TPA: ATP-binding protein, partial [Candidatus Acidoferrum sp.]|nr:ATP-binding protein [Candidatus Acidoferrum sp.]
AAWLFYAVWLSLGLNFYNADAIPLLAMLRQWCLNCSAVFLLWGSASFLGSATKQRLIALFTGFLFTWSYVEFFHVRDQFWGSVPVFGLMGVASLLCAGAFFKLRRTSRFVGAGLLALGFLLWGFYLISCPFVAGNPQLLVAAFFISAVVQLLIAVSMIVLVLEEARRFTRQTEEQLYTATVEKSRLATKVSLAEERYRTLFQQAQEGIVLVDATDLRIVDWNPAARRLLGIASKSTDPHLISDFLVLPQDGEKVHWFDLLSQSPQVTLRCLDGRTVMVDLTSSALELEGKPAYHLVMRELNERARLEQQLREAEKLSALGQLASGIAHEVNNPLAIMNAHLELILARPGCDGRMRLDIQKVIHECDRAAALIRNFLAVARNKHQDLESIDLNRMISSIADNQRLARASQDLRYTLQLDPQCPPVHGVPSQLERVFINLFRNAEQAAEQHSDSPHIKVTTRRKGELVQVRVEDNGPGVPAHLVSRIFEPFFTTKKMGAGTGLGLSISHQIVADHHGRIFHEPSALGGAAFVVELPLVTILDNDTAVSAAPEPEPDAPPAPRNAAPSPSHGARILMIDDEAALAEMICEYLNMTGHRAQFCSSTEEALALMERVGFDLIISDFRMPGLTGEQLFERTLKRDPDLARRVVFMTGDIIGADAKRFFSTHDVPCLTKPCALPTIQQFINSRLEFLARTPRPRSLKRA